MADKFQIEIDISGVDRATRGLGALATAAGGVLGGGGGGGAAGVGGLMARSGMGMGLLKMLPMIGKVIAGLGALALAAHRAADMMTEFSKMRNSLGSSTAQTAFLRNVGGALGVDMGAMAMRAQSASQSGMGAAAAARAGLSPAFDIGTAVDRGSRLEQLLEHGRKLAEQNEKAALAFFRNLDIEEAFDYTKLQKDTLEMMRKEAELSKQMYSPERINAAYAYNAQLGRIQRKWEMFTTGLGHRMMNNFSKVLDWLEKPAPDPGMMGLGLRGAGAAGSAKSAQAANTAALNANTMEIRRLQGLYGGGSRARSAIPAAFGPGFGFFLQDALRANTMKLGAYSISM